MMYRLSSLEVDSAPWVQILNKAVRISHSIWESYILNSFPSSRLGSNLGMIIGLEEETKFKLELESDGFCYAILAPNMSGAPRIKADDETKERD